MPVPVEWYDWGSQAWDWIYNLVENEGQKLVAPIKEFYDSLNIEDAKRVLTTVLGGGILSLILVPVLKWRYEKWVRENYRLVVSYTDSPPCKAIEPRNEEGGKQKIFRIKVELFDRDGQEQEISKCLALVRAEKKGNGQNRPIGGRSVVDFLDLEILPSADSLVKHIGIFTLSDEGVVEVLTEKSPKKQERKWPIKDLDFFRDVGVYEFTVVVFVNDRFTRNISLTFNKADFWDASLLEERRAKKKFFFPLKISHENATKRPPCEKCKKLLCAARPYGLTAAAHSSCDDFQVNSGNHTPSRSVKCFRLLVDNEGKEIVRGARGSIVRIQKVGGSCLVQERIYLTWAGKIWRPETFSDHNVFVDLAPMGRVGEEDRVQGMMRLNILEIDENDRTELHARGLLLLPEEILSKTAQDELNGVGDFIFDFEITADGLKTRKIRAILHKRTPWCQSSLTLGRLPALYYQGKDLFLHFLRRATPLFMQFQRK